MLVSLTEGTIAKKALVKKFHSRRKLIENQQILKKVLSFVEAKNGNTGLQMGFIAGTNFLFASLFPIRKPDFEDHLLIPEGSKE